MQIPILLDRASGQSLQSQVFSQIRTLILDGRLRPGSRLPSSRDLARQTDASRNTVSLSYERLIAEGYLETRGGVGTFVASDLPDPPLAPAAAPTAAAAPAARRYRGPFLGQDPALVVPGRLEPGLNFRVGRPDPQSFPLATWRRLLNRRLRTASEALTWYADPSGLRALRQAIAAHLGSARGIVADPAQVVVVAGVQEALNLIATLAIREGARVVVENPAYKGAANVFEAHRAALVPVPVDSGGLVVSRLPRGETALAYVTPSHQFPLGHTLTLDRRLGLIEWAASSGAYIFEDDYDSDFRYQGSPLTALQGLDRHETVIYASTFSKSVGPGLRLGYLVVPPHLAEPARRAKALSSHGHPWLDQAVMADFIDSGEFTNHLRRIRKLYLGRRDALVAALRAHFGDVRIIGLEGGMHIAWELPATAPDADTLRTAAVRLGVGFSTVADGHAVALDRARDFNRLVFLGFAALDDRQIATGVTRLARVMDTLSRTRA